jgi:hypothetical protein
MLERYIKVYWWVLGAGEGDRVLRFLNALVQCVVMLVFCGETASTDGFLYFLIISDHPKSRAQIHAQFCPGL